MTITTSEAVAQAYINGFVTGWSVMAVIVMATILMPSKAQRRQAREIRHAIHHHRAGDLARLRSDWLWTSPSFEGPTSDWLRQKAITSAWVEIEQHDQRLHHRIARAARRAHRTIAA